MKIWTLTINDDNGLPTPTVHFTKADADLSAAGWVQEAWRNWFGADGDPCPADWRAAHETLSDQAGFLDSISMAEHDISGHPDLEGLTPQLGRTDQ